MLIPWLLGWESPGLTFSVVAHFGTALGILIVFWQDWSDMAQSVFCWLRTHDQNDSNLRFLSLLIVGTLPVALIGVLFNGFFTRLFENPLVAALMLLVTALLLGIGETRSTSASLEKLTWRDALLIGLFQTLALIPGISRSGSTMTAARLRGIERGSAARFSFLLALPTIAGAGFYQSLTLLNEGVDVSELGVLAVGFLSALGSGYLVVRWLLIFLRSRSTHSFALYCVIFSVLNLLMLLTRGG